MVMMFARLPILMIPKYDQIIDGNSLSIIIICIIGEHI